MDPLAQVQQEPNISQSGKQNFSLLSILLPLFTLLVGFALGLLVSRIIFPVSTPSTQQLTTAPETTKAELPADLPIGLDLLKNPAVYEWRGDVNGKVVAKDEHTLTIEDEKGNKITVTELLPDGHGTFKTTYLKYLKKTNSRPIELTLKDITLGTMLKGEFFVFRNFPDTPVGSMFAIVE